MVRDLPGATSQRGNHRNAAIIVITSMIVKVQSAKVALAQAEANLEKCIREIQSAPRWEKVAISESLENAFDTLQGARAELAELEAMIEQSETESSSEILQKK